VGHVPRVRIPHVASLGLLLATVAGSALARADGARDYGEWLPGDSRTISRKTSASLDAPVTEIVFTPHDELKVAADLAIARIPTGPLALRPGFSGFSDILYANTGGFWPVPPSTGSLLFRGHFELSLAVDAERLARRWLGSAGAIEVVFVGGHESDHVLGSGTPDQGYVSAPRAGDIVEGGGGNFAGPELALRLGLGPRLELWARVADRIYFNAPVLHEPSLEGGLRWFVAPGVVPLVSVFGEALLVDPNQNRGRDGGDVQLLAGVGLPGRHGEVIPLVALDIGNQKGLLVNHREADFVVGVRYAPF
jgi:hypothetical protein